MWDDKIYELYVFPIYILRDEISFVDSKFWLIKSQRLIEKIII